MPRWFVLLLALSASGPASALRLLATLDVGRQPKQVAISPDGRTAYVTNFGARSISVVDLEKRRVLKKIRTESAPVEVAFAPDGRLAYVTGFRPGRLWKIDATTHQVVAETEGHPYPKGIAVSPDKRWVFFSSWWWPRGLLTEVDADTLARRRTLRLGNRPRGVAVSPDGRTLAVCNFAEEDDDEGRGLDLIDVATFRLLGRVETGLAPRHVLFTTDGRQAIVSNLGSSSIAVVEVKRRRLARRIVVGGGPKTIGLSPEGRTLYVADYSGRRVLAVGLEAGKVTKRVRLGDRASGLAVVPGGREILVTGWDQGKLFILTTAETRARR
jgi:YVTN family beta-propeller protein